MLKKYCKKLNSNNITNTPMTIAIIIPLVLSSPEVPGIAI